MRDNHSISQSQVYLTIAAFTRNVISSILEHLKTMRDFCTYPAPPSFSVKKIGSHYHLNVLEGGEILYPSLRVVKKER